MIFRYIKALFGVYDHQWSNIPTVFGNRVAHEIGGDFHLGSDYCDNPNLMTLVKKWINEYTYEQIKARRMYLNGDIIDLKCCHPDDVEYLKLLNQQLHDLFKDHYEDDGNHGAVSYGFRPTYDKYFVHAGVPYVLIESPSGRKYAMTHGDMLIDRLRRGTSKANYWKDYRNRVNGIKGLKKLKVKLLDKMDMVKAMRPLPEGYIELCTQVAIEIGVHGLIVNHFHVEAVRYYDHASKEHIFVPAHNMHTVML